VESEAWLAKCYSLVTLLGRSDLMGYVSFEGPWLLGLQRRDNFVIVVAGGGSADVCSTSGTLIPRRVRAMKGTARLWLR
jgi:hypothetical protein